MNVEAGLKPGLSIVYESYLIMKLFERGGI